jgi:hypothetical protein
METHLFEFIDDGNLAKYEAPASVQKKFDGKKGLR